MATKVNYSVNMRDNRPYGGYKVGITQIVTDAHGALLNVGKEIDSRFSNQEDMFRYVMKKSKEPETLFFSNKTGLYFEYLKFVEIEERGVSDELLSLLKLDFQNTTRFETNDVFNKKSLLLSNAYTAEQVMSRMLSGFKQNELMIRLEESNGRGGRNHIDFHFSLERAEQLHTHLGRSIEALKEAKKHVGK